MKRRNVPILPFVCELNSTAKLDGAWNESRRHSNFCRMRWCWKPNGGQTRLWRNSWRKTAHSRAAALQAQFSSVRRRFALVLRKLIQEKNVSHIHATSSRALVCALMLKKLLGVTVSATIEPRSELSREWIQNALSECVGGRLSSRKLVEQLGGAFFLDKTTFRSAPQKTLGQITQKTHIDLTTGSRFWQQWAELLLRWNGSDRKSKIENPK